MENLSVWPELARENIDAYLDKQIHEAALRYDWDRYGIADLYDGEKDQPLYDKAQANDDALFRLVLLCRARSQDWSSVIKRAAKQADRERYGECRQRHIFSDTPSAAEERDKLYEDTVCRLIDPLTLLPVDINELSDEDLAQGVANERIQVEYGHPSSGRAFPEEL